MPKKSVPVAAAEPAFEVQLARLVEVVDRLERGDLALAEALQLYEEGVRLGAVCQQVLDNAELHVQRLSGGNDGESLEPWTPAV